jgi:hypothetical protein
MFDLHRHANENRRLLQMQKLWMPILKPIELTRLRAQYMLSGSPYIRYYFNYLFEKENFLL